MFFSVILHEDMESVSALFELTSELCYTEVERAASGESMQDNEELRRILKEVSAVISESLSSPATMQKLEYLRDHGYQLYLVMEAPGESNEDLQRGPVMPIKVESKVTKGKASASSKTTDMFSLSKDDRDFLRTLKIKVD